MSNAAPNLFSGIKDAKARLDANYERPGHYVLRIDALKIGRTRKGDDFMAVEKTVLHVLDDDEGKGHKVTENVTHMMMAKHDSFLGNVKAMFAKLLDCATDDVDSDACMAVCGDDQPMSGMIIECKNRNITTKAGNPFTVINYIREVPAPELIETGMLDQRVLDLYFEGGSLLRRMAGIEE
ncbi:MAG: hypothetical protein GY906_12910 [bacterium]|nr:hypothetical protein [bacterium]